MQSKVSVFHMEVMTGNWVTPSPKLYSMYMIYLFFVT